MNLRFIIVDLILKFVYASCPLTELLISQQQKAVRNRIVRKLSGEKELKIIPAGVAAKQQVKECQE